jgi:hypothetical protein
MTWALIVVVMWLALAAVAALVIGRSICMADQQDAGETAEQPNTVQNDARGVAGQRVPTRLSRRHGGNLTEASAALPSQSSGVPVPTLTRSG